MWLLPINGVGSGCVGARVVVLVHRVDQNYCSCILSYSGANRSCRTSNQTESRNKGNQIKNRYTML